MIINKNENSHKIFLNLVEIPFPKHGVGSCSLKIFCCSGIPKLIHTAQNNFQKYIKIKICS
jgi:hypothetical protein